MDGGSLSAAYPFLPYCGAPPLPGSLLWRWNLDPVLIAVLVGLLAAYAFGTERRLGGDSELPPWRRASFYAGWALGAAALVSPLCPLSVSLFSARVGQHMLLATIVAPLVAAGRPHSVYAAAFGVRREVSRLRHADLLASGAFTVALWYWHAPAPYTATFVSDVVYWLMHVTMFGASYALWATLFDHPADRLGGFLAAGLFTSIQMGFLGAVLTLGKHALYAPHATTTAAWGLSPLQDQALGGVIMWVPAGLIFVGAIVTAFASALRRAEANAAIHGYA